LCKFIKSKVTQYGLLLKITFQTKLHDMGNAIKILRKSAGLTQEKLAELCNCTTSQIVKLERGERRLSDVWLDRLSPALNATRAEILGEKAAAPLDPINRAHRIIGYVQAGNWVECLEIPEDDQKVIMLPTGEHPQSKDFFVLQAKGDSMNRANIADGSFLVCLPFHLYKDTLQSGAKVIAHRIDEHDHYEATVKQLDIQPNGDYWLVPHSDNPEHQSIKMPPREEWPDDLEHFSHTQVRVSAVVMGVLPSFSPLASK